jgi:hypothetical protein
MNINAVAVAIGVVSTILLASTIAAQPCPPQCHPTGNKFVANTIVSSNSGAQSCVVIAFFAANGQRYLLGGATNHKDCAAFQAEFLSRCCAPTETVASTDVCTICALGIDNTKL